MKTFATNTIWEWFHGLKICQLLSVPSHFIFIAKQRFFFLIEVKSLWSSVLWMGTVQLFGSQMSVAYKTFSQLFLSQLSMRVLTSVYGFYINLLHSYSIQPFRNLLLNLLTLITFNLYNIVVSTRYNVQSLLVKEIVKWKCGNKETLPGFTITLNVKLRYMQVMAQYRYTDTDICWNTTWKFQYFGVTLNPDRCTMF